MQAQPSQRGHQFAGLGSEIIAEEQPAAHLPRHQPDFAVGGVSGSSPAGRGQGVILGFDPVAAAQSDRPALPAGADAQTGQGLEVFEFDRFQAALFTVPDHGTGQGMVGQPFERAGQPRHLGLAARGETFHPLDLQVAGGQRAGFVHGHHVHLGQFFNRRPAPEEDAAPRAAGDGCQDGRGDGQDQRTGGSHHQQRHREVEGRPRRVVRADGRQAGNTPPEEKHERRQPQHGVGVAGAETVGEPLRGGLEMLGLADEAEDFFEGAFLDGADHQRLDRPPQVQGPRQHRIAHALFHRHRFAGEVGFIGGGPAADHLGIHREQRAGLDQDALAGPQLLDGCFHLPTGRVQDDRRLRRGAEQGLDLPLGAAQGVMFQRAGKRKEEQQNRTFVPLADAGTAGRHCQHEEMHVHHAVPEPLPDLDRRVPAAGHVGGQMPRQGVGVLAHRPGPQRKQPAQPRGQQLPFPLAKGRLVLGQLDLAWHHARQGQGAPAPKPRGGGTAFAGNGGTFTLLTDHQTGTQSRVHRLFARPAIRRPRQQLAGAFFRHPGRGTGPTKGGLQTPLQRRGIHPAQGGQRQGGVTPPEGHGLQGGLLGKGCRHAPNQTGRTASRLRGLTRRTGW